MENKNSIESQTDILSSTFENIKQKNLDEIRLKLNQICRTCLCETNTNIELSAHIDIKGKTMVLLEMLNSFANIKFSINDKIPKIICIRCLQNVKSAYYFKKQCEESDMELRRIFKSSDLIENSPKYIELVESLYSNYNIANDDDNIENQTSIENVDKITNVNCSVSRKDLVVNKNPSLENEENKSIIEIENSTTHIENINLKKDNFHVCEECGKSFSSRQILKNHCTVHIIERPYNCSICSKDFKHKFQLKDHMKGHENRKEFICENCGKSFNRSKELITHMRVHSGLKPFNCTICNKNFVGSDTLSKHIKTHTGEKNYVCEYCMKSFTLKNQLKIHMRKHTGEKPYSCNFENCNRKFATIHSLNMHIPVHKNNRPFTCITCGKSFSREQDKKKHENIHNRQNYVCSWIGCSRSYHSITGLKEHLMTHSGEKHALCTHCGKSFTRKADLKRHILTHTQERPFKCNHCGKGFNQQYGLTQHLRYHEGKACFICDLCGKGFMRKATLEKHKLVHSGIRNHKCEFCDRAFTISAHLIRHKRIHTGERPYKCNICCKAFSTRSGYVVHLRSHTGEKPYQCKFCEKTCTTSTALKIHTRNHTGEKPYACLQCGLAFSRSDLRSLHMKTCCPDSLSEIIISHQVPQDFFLSNEDLRSSNHSLVNSNMTSQLMINTNPTQENIQSYNNPGKICNTLMSSNLSIPVSTLFSSNSVSIQQPVTCIQPDESLTPTNRIYNNKRLH